MRSDVFLSSLLALHHDFHGAHDNALRYNGRWLSSPNRLVKEASFSGSSFEFAVYNTSTVILDLANLSVDVPVYPGEEDHGKPSIVLAPAKTKTKRTGPVNICITLNGTIDPKCYTQVSGLVKIVIDLELHARHKIKVTFLHIRGPGTIQLKGLWLEHGGHLKSLKRPTPVPQKKLVEVVALSTFLNQDDEFIKSGTAGWTSLVEQAFDDVLVSSIGFSDNDCMTKECRAQKSGTASNLALDIFFRAGPPGTHLYDRYWPFGSSPDLAKGLVLSFGTTDVEAFFNQNTTSKHQATWFIDDFARTYSSFVQTIRRTAYSPSSMSRSLHLSQAGPQNAIDTSYLYNSAPSNIPIFLVIPPMPQRSATDRSMVSLLHLATSEVLNELEWHIGDKKTFVIDTAGWLDNSDFEDITTLPSLKQSGHIKFAYHLSTHLCHYLVDTSGFHTECAFDQHDECVGNLHVPETANIGKLINERKVAKMHELFGVVSTL